MPNLRQWLMVGVVEFADVDDLQVVALRCAREVADADRWMTYMGRGS